MSRNLKIIVILGQTSTGKSDFAVEIAKKLRGEIISADSRQVYKGMNLGTGKITNKEMKSVPHHLLDVASPKKIFNVSSYKKLADNKIKEIIARGNVPIICGGTGFYIDAVVNGTFLPEVPPDKVLRKKLSKLSKDKLFKMLEKLDPVRSKTIDKNNPVRLIRAIEISIAIGRVPPQSPISAIAEMPYSVIKLGLTLPDEILKERIKTRLLLRIKKGMLKEIKDLHESGVSWKRMHELGLEYRYGSQYLQGKITKQEMLDKILTESWRYAKRQKTWFKRDKDIIWIDPRKEKLRVIKLVKSFLK